MQITDRQMNIALALVAAGLLAVCIITGGRFFCYIQRDSHWDRYLGMTAAMTQIPVPTAALGLFEGHTGKGHVSTRVLFGITPKGYYVAIADVENNFCIPKEWSVLNSFVNGEKKYIKQK